MLSVWLVLVFLVGACAGGLLNVAIYRLPYEKSLWWPGWRCASCYQPLRWFDALPLVGYWLRLGHCGACGSRFPLRYFVVELLTGLGFAALFYLEVVLNVHDLALFRQQQAAIAAGHVPWQAWLVVSHHAVLLCFLLVASFIDLDHHEIPLPLTTVGTVIGLIGALLLPWPWPDAPPQAPVVRLRPPGIPVNLLAEPPPPGLYSWPVGYPLPDWLPPGSWLLGLATGLAGVLAGMLLLRAVRFVFSLGRGKEGLGVGDADLMMMAGAFLGWQPVIIAFFVSVFPAMLIGVAQVIFRGDQELAFGPSLSLGILITMLGWQWIGPHVSVVFFDLTWLVILIVAGAMFLLLASFLIRLVRGTGGDDEPAKG
jgi:leader peptidase (prepilin peptidase)/N-methyltransferase